MMKSIKFGPASLVLTFILGITTSLADQCDDLVQQEKQIIASTSQEKQRIEAQMRDAAPLGDEMQSLLCENEKVELRYLTGEVSRRRNTERVCGSRLNEVCDSACMQERLTEQRAVVQKQCSNLQPSLQTPAQSGPRPATAAQPHPMTGVPGSPPAAYRPQGANAEYCANANAVDRASAYYGAICNPTSGNPSVTNQLTSQQAQMIALLVKQRDANPPGSDAWNTINGLIDEILLKFRDALPAVDSTPPATTDNQASALITIDTCYKWCEKDYGAPVGSGIKICWLEASNGFCMKWRESPDGKKLPSDYDPHESESFSDDVKNAGLYTQHCPQEADAAWAKSQTAGASCRGSWFVIAGSWPPGEVEKLNARLSLLSTNGIQARIVKTDDYPKLRPGLSAVVLGPFSKDQAQARLTTVQVSVPDAFIKEAF